MLETVRTIAKPKRVIPGGSGARTVLSLRGVSLGFPVPGGREVKVLSHVGLEVREREFICVLGPSGCGKSTLLRVLAGLLDPSEGHRVIEDPALETDPLARSMNFQSPVLLPWLTVEQNALLPFELARRRRSDEVRARLDELLRMVGLHGFRDALPGELSGGMQMRAALVRAFVTAPRLMLMDEPFAALDEVTRNRLAMELRKLAREAGATVVFVTHSIQEAVFLGTRILLFSPRPARLVDTFDVDLPSARNEATRRSTAYLDFCGRVYAEIAHG